MPSADFDEAGRHFGAVRSAKRKFVMTPCLPTLDIGVNLGRTPSRGVSAATLYRYISAPRTVNTAGA